MIEKIIKTRRSVRKFKDQPVSDELLDKVIESAVYAPSASNRQGWRFIVIKDEQKEKLVEAGTAWFVKDTKASLILVLYDNRSDNREYRDWIVSGGMAVQNMVLTAHSLGLGSCVVCNLPTKRTLRNIFGIPKCYDPICLLVVGHPLSKNPVLKKDQKKFYCVGSFDFDVEKVKWRRRAFLRWVFLRLPVGVRKWLKPLSANYERIFQ